LIQFLLLNFTLPIPFGWICHRTIHFRCILEIASIWRQFMHRGLLALFCLTLCAALVAAPGLTRIGGLYGSAWAKDGGNNGGGNGNSGGGGRGGGNNGGGNAGNSGSGKSASSGATRSNISKSGAFNPATASISAANDAVAAAHKALLQATEAFEAALAEPETKTTRLLELERAITAAEKSVRQASDKAAALNDIID